MRIDILTLFPDMCEAVLSESILKRARGAGLIDVRCRDIRPYTRDKHHRVDDSPYGGGFGLVMQAQPVYDCFAALCAETGSRPHLVYLSPAGQTLTQQKARELAKLPHLALLCGHYEGMDERVLEEIVDEEISIGDYVLTGGELPALVLTDCITRMQPGVLAADEAFEKESHYASLLEYPQYTKPPVWHGRSVPDILLTGHHENIDLWQRRQMLSRTLERRPDLLEKADLDAQDILYLYTFPQARELPFLFERLVSCAERYVRTQKKVSPTSLQRKLKADYALCVRLLDALYARGVVSAYEQGKPRTVLPDPEEGEV
ncbi:MAG: tRNA (guanosine(37)-N1)-methyltransferase TrmD [Clostridia bacterium]|nr:tRNA (guanosine(37)-N1)-methyltransferase TrmD [Clostridia bacterium]